MKFHRKTILAVFTSLFVVTLIWNAWLYTLPHHVTIWNFIYNSVYGLIYFIGGVVAVAYAIHFGTKSNLGKMLLFLGLGLLSFWGGNIVWVYYTFFLMTEIPFPSFADILYTLYYPLMAVGTYYMLRIYQNLITKAVIRDSIVIVVVAFIAIFGFFGRPTISSELSFIQNFISVYYPFGDVVILSIALIALRIGSGKIHFSLYIFAIGLTMQAIGDLLFIYRTATEVYWNGDIADTFYASSAFFCSIGLFEIINSLLQASGVPMTPVPAPQHS